jgi:formate dehydrogenase (NADP+) alpha subunit
MVSLTIDGKSVQVESGTTILEAAATVGITIPTLCWLQKVSPTGACRICAVEIEGVDRTMTACNTPVKEGIKVTTQTPALEEMRRKVMELLLVNHPLDCPVCDAGGECDLQNACYEHKAINQDFSAILERRAIRYDWPLIESDPNRCILCEKCVKVDHEVVGCDAITIVNRGDATLIDTWDGKPLDCEFCGNCVAVCPTGTLISKPFKFRGRPWAFAKVQSVCAFCGMGCQIEYHAKNGMVHRTTSEDDTYNNGNLCINGRFGYGYLHNEERLTAPMVRQQGGALAKTDWNSAMSAAVGKLKEIVDRDGAAAVAGFGSPRLSNEENFLFQKFLRAGVGTNNIDSEAGLGYAQAQAQMLKRFGFSGTSATIDKIEDAQVIVVIGTDLNAEATALEYRIIKSVLKRDAQLVLMNMREVKLRKFSNMHLQNLPGRELAAINGLMKALIEAGAALPAGAEALKADLVGVTLADLAKASGITEKEFLQTAALFTGKTRVAIVFGNDVIRSNDAAAKIDAVGNLAVLTGAAGETGCIYPIDSKTNTVGLLDMGVAPDTLPGLQSFPEAGAAIAEAWEVKLPTAAGKDIWGIVEGIEQGTIKALYLVGCDLAAFPDNARIRKALAKLELLIVQDIFENDSMEYAHVVFAAAAPAEKSGSFTSNDNRVQGFGKAINPPGQAKDDLEIIAELYSRFTSSTQKVTPAYLIEEITAVNKLYVRDDSQKGIVKRPAAVKAQPSLAPIGNTAAQDLPKFQLLVGPIGYHNGTSSTRSPNNTTVSPAGYVELHTGDAAALGIVDGGQVRVTSGNASIVAPAKVTAKVQPGLLFAPSHFRALNANSLLKGSSTLVEVKVEKA